MGWGGETLWGKQTCPTKGLEFGSVWPWNSSLYYFFSWIPCPTVQLQGVSQQLIQKYFLISSIKKHTVTCKVCQNFTDAGTFSYIYREGIKKKLIILMENSTKGVPPPLPPPSWKIILIFRGFFHKFFYCFKVMYWSWNEFCMIWVIFFRTTTPFYWPYKMSFITVNRMGGSNVKLYVAKVNVSTKMWLITFG